MERDILLRYRYANDFSLDEKVTVRSNLIDDFIRVWNKTYDSVGPLIYRHTCFICDEYGNIYKDTDQFFVGDIIDVYTRPDIGKPFRSFFPSYSITRVHTDDGEIGTNVRQLKGDCYMVFRSGSWGTRDLSNEQNRIENLKKIKIANAISNNMNRLELYARQQGTSIQDLLPMIGEMATDLNVRLPVKESKTKRARKEERREEDDEGDPICVIV
jgi:hypothetical protein